jgi:hypothetical protein
MQNMLQRDMNVKGNNPLAVTSLEANIGLTLQQLMQPARDKGLGLWPQKFKIVG